MSDIVSVNFRGDTLYGFRNDDGTFMALKPMVEAMGLDWSGQLQRVKRDPILVEGMVVMPIPFGRGGQQDAVCIKLELVNGWLFTIDSSRIKDDEVRQRVQLYQRECYTVLHDYFSGRRIDVPMADAANLAEVSDSVKLRMVSEAGHYFGSRAAREMWFLQGLPIVPSMRTDQQADLFDPRSIRHPEQEAA